YRQRDASVEARVADLLARMTLEEKVAQLQGVWNRKREIQNARGEFDPSKAQALLGQGIGEVARPSEIAGAPADRNVRTAREQAVFVNAVQRWLIENTRLGIPAMFHEEGLHGLPRPPGPGEHVGPGVDRTRHERGCTRRSSPWRAACPLPRCRSRTRS